MDDGGVSPEVRWKLEEAAKVVRERTRRDRDQADDEEVRRILEAIAENMFRSDFEIGALRRAARAWFAEHKDTTPDGYRRVRRVEVALYLLDYTDAEIPVIARLVGYGSARSFSSAFNNVMGYRPSEERRRWRAGLVDGQPPGSEKPQVPRILESKEQHRRTVAPVLRKAAAGGLTNREAAEALGRLRFVLPSPDLPLPRARISGYVYLGGGTYDPEAVPALRRCHDRSRPTLSYAEERAHVEAAERSTVEVLERFDLELPRRLQSVLEELRENLLRPEYGLAILKKELIVDNMDLAAFTRLMGAPPWQYVLEARMDVVARLLSVSPLSVRAIAFHVDYAGPQQLRRAFKRWSGGLTPSDFRAGIRAAAERAGRPLPAEYLHWRFLGGLETAPPEERARWFRYMERIYLLEPRVQEIENPSGLRQAADGCTTGL